MTRTKTFEKRTSMTEMPVREAFDLVENGAPVEIRVRGKRRPFCQRSLKGLPVGLRRATAFHPDYGLFNKLPLVVLETG